MSKQGTCERVKHRCIELSKNSMWEDANKENAIRKLNHCVIKSGWSSTVEKLQGKALRIRIQMSKIELWNTTQSKIDKKQQPKLQHEIQ